MLDRESKTLKVINMFESPKYMEMAKLSRKWFLPGYINKDAAMVKDFALMQAGKDFAVEQELSRVKEMSQGLGFEVLQKVVEAKLYTTMANVTGNVSFISRTSGDPEQAMMFINMLYGNKYLLKLFDFGIEGKHYVKKSDTTIDYPNGVDAKTDGYKNEPWMWGNQMNTFLFPNEVPKKWRSSNSSTRTRADALGFSRNAEPVKNEVAVCQNVLKQYGDAIASGAVDPEKEIHKFVEALKAAGMNKIIAEKQRQLDLWAKSK